MSGRAMPILHKMDLDGRVTIVDPDYPQPKEPETVVDVYGMMRHAMEKALPVDAFFVNLEIMQRIESRLDKVDFYSGAFDPDLLSGKKTMFNRP